MADGQADSQNIIHDFGDGKDGDPFDRLTARIGTTRYELVVLAELRSDRTSIVLQRWTERKGDEGVEIPGLSSSFNAKSIDMSLQALAKHLVNAS